MRLFYLLIYSAWGASSIEFTTTSCSSEPCVYGKCLLDNNTRNGFSCECDSRFKGELCDQDVNECEKETCSGVGTCVNHNLTADAYNEKDLGFVCVCPEGRAGTRCEHLVDMCALYGQDSERGSYCKNGGKCEGNICTCRDGWAGQRCERAVPLVQDFINSGCTAVPIVASLAQKSFRDGKCDPEFNKEACFFDGMDCVSQMSERGEPRPASCFHDSEKELNLCTRSYADGKCREECNSPQCGFDGGDCKEDSPHLTKDAHIGVIFYTDPYTVFLNVRKIRFEIGRWIYNSHVNVAVDEGGEMIYEWNATRPNSSLGRRIPTDDLLTMRSDFSNSGTLIFFNIDVEGCRAAKSRVSRLNYIYKDTGFPNCYEKEEVAARFLSVELSETGNIAIGTGLRVKTVFAANYFKLPWQQIPVWVIVSFVTCLLMLVTIIVLLCFLWKCKKKTKSPSATPKWPLTEDTVDYTEGLTTTDTPNVLYDCPDQGFLNNNAVPSTPYPHLDDHSHLFDAVRRGDVAYIRRAIADKVAILYHKDRHGLGLLHHAVAQNDAAMLKILLFETEPGQMNVFERNNAGQSPLVFAAATGHPQLDCFIVLVDAIAKRRNPVSTLPKSPSGYVCGGDSALVLPLSGESHEQWALCDATGRSSVHYAAENNLPQLVHYLSAYGADVDFVDLRGDAPLHIATRSGNSAAVIALLDCRAARVARDADGLIPLKIAENRGFTELADILRSRMAGSTHHTLRRIKRRRITGGSDASSRIMNSDGYYSLDSAQRGVYKALSELGDSPSLVTPLANGPPAFSPEHCRRMSTPTSDVTPMNRSSFGSEVDVNRGSEYGSVRGGSIIRPRILTPPVQIIEEEVRRSFTVPSLVDEASRYAGGGFGDGEPVYTEVTPQRFKRYTHQSTQDLHLASCPLSPLVPQDPPMLTFKPAI